MRELNTYVPDEHSILKAYRTHFEHLNIDCSGKSVLNIRAWLWLRPDIPATGTIRYYLKGESEPVTIEKTIVTRPRPNKNIAVISKRFGRRQAQKGIPLVFDSLDELRKIERIEIIWNIESFNKTIIADYSVSFDEPQQDRIYSLWTYDEPILYFDPTEDGFIVTDKGLVSNSTKSIYNDFYFLTLCYGSIAVMKELHKPDSSFRIDFDNLENLNTSITNALLRNIAENMCSSDDEDNESDDTASVCFYHSDLSLNDYTA